VSARAEAWAWLAQRASAAVLALCVSVHLVTIVLAVRGGLSAEEILARTRGSIAWLGFYGVFVLAVAVHAPLGLRAILREWTTLHGPRLEIALAGLALALLWLGWRAVAGLFA
jgi:fumarate reductase subunit C